MSNWRIPDNLRNLVLTGDDLLITWSYDQLDRIVRKTVASNKTWTTNGEVATYIPELRKGNPDYLGLSVFGGEGIIQAGDVHVPFTLQSISKVITLMIALRDRGTSAVFSRVGQEPTGDPFNSIVKLETLEQRPLNPMINAGAIAVCSLITGNSVGERFAKIAELISTVTGNPARLNHQVYQSEMATGHRNRALAYFMKDTGVLEGDVEEVLDLYFRQCSIEVSCEDLAKMGLFLANKGALPNGHHLIPASIARTVTTFMVTCGMYNASGEFAIQVGIPAKSGVAGGILAAVPGQLGIGVFGPALDKKGNSIAGVRMLMDLSRELELSIF